MGRHSAHVPPTRPTATAPTAARSAAPAASDPATDPTPATAPARRGALLGWAAWLGVLVLAVVLAVLLRIFVLASFSIPSGSMEPTLHGCGTCRDDYVVVARLAYRFHDVNRGDVVVFDRPVAVADPDKYLIKRVIGLPGETVSGHDGHVWIGNRPLQEPYVRPQCGAQADFPATTVPDGQVFVMGDNRCGSFDSRGFGTVPESTIVGRAFLLVWPLRRLHLL